MVRMDTNKQPNGAILTFPSFIDPTDFGLVRTHSGLRAAAASCWADKFWEDRILPFGLGVTCTDEAGDCAAGSTEMSAGARTGADGGRREANEREKENERGRDTHGRATTSRSSFHPCRRLPQHAPWPCGGGWRDRGCWRCQVHGTWSGASSASLRLPRRRRVRASLAWSRSCVRTSWRRGCWAKVSVGRWSVSRAGSLGAESWVAAKARQRNC